MVKFRVIKPEGKQSKWLKKHWRRGFLTAFSIILALGIIILPIFPAIPWVGWKLNLIPPTESYFHFYINENFKPANSSLSPVSFSVAEGYITLSGVGGLCVDNKLTLSLRVILYQNATLGDPINQTVINHPTSIQFSTEFGETPKSGMNVNSPPQPFELTVTPSNNWKASKPIEFYVSGPESISVTFLDSNITAPAGTPSGLPTGVNFTVNNVIQISDESVYVSAINDEYILSLTLIVIALTFLQIGLERKNAKE